MVNKLSATLLDEGGQVLGENERDYSKTAEFEINRWRSYSHQIAGLVIKAEELHLTDYKINLRIQKD